MQKTQELLLVRGGLVFVQGEGGQASGQTLHAFEVELAALGYIPSVKLLRRIGRLPPDALARLSAWLCQTLAASLGADRKHEPLFRKFPQEIPADTDDLWLRKVLTHYFGATDQPCPMCGARGTSHVLAPCLHVVCDRCFDGANYSACPVCEQPVDRASPFFEPSPALAARLPKERVRFKRLDLGDDLDAAARALFLALASREQAMSPDDRAALDVLLTDHGPTALAWLPAVIPVRENVALVFGTLLRRLPAPAVMEVARRYLATATDILRLVAAFSGADPALQRETVLHTVDRTVPPNPWVASLLARFGVTLQSRTAKVQVPIQVRRFKVAKLSRAQRRELLSFLERVPRDTLIEDLLRHRSYWVWLGEFLHPHEYARRFPVVAHAFQIVRGQDPHGKPAPRFHGWKSRVESALRTRDTAAALELLEQRPGELMRRFDHALRSAERPDADALVASFVRHAPDFPTPALLTLRNHFAHRDAHALRVYWPKGAVSRGVSAPDTRPLLPRDLTAPIIQAIESELLRRFGAQSHFDACVIDDELARIIVPFNERTASAAAVNLPRGSSLELPPGKTIRLFVHWCEPPAGDHTTDVDLSVAFYDAEWKNPIECSYYQLKCVGPDGAAYATSSGDLRAAPFPDGASEFVDVDRYAARRAGFRYAVMVVSNYAGLPFSRLERGWAGYMLRDDTSGAHFDPRTVEHRFALSGDNGTYLPLVVDLATNTLHWLDTYARGQLQFNNAANASQDISRHCPERIDYFGRGERPSMRELALLHAAARAKSVVLRGTTTRLYERGPGEEPAAFLARLTTGEPDRRGVDPEALAPMFAALYRGDLALPAGASCYALFREQVTAPIAAADLIR